MAKLCLPEFLDFTRVFSLVKMLCNRRLELESSKIHYSTSVISPLHRWSELFIQLFLESIARKYTIMWHPRNNIIIPLCIYTPVKTICNSNMKTRLNTINKP